MEYVATIKPAHPCSLDLRPTLYICLEAELCDPLRLIISSHYPTCISILSISRCLCPGNGHTYTPGFAFKCAYSESLHGDCITYHSYETDDFLLDLFNKSWHQPFLSSRIGLNSSHSTFTTLYHQQL